MRAGHEVQFGIGGAGWRGEQDIDGALIAAAQDGERDAFARGLGGGEEVQPAFVIDFAAIDGGDEIAASEAGFVGGAVFVDFGDDDADGAYA